jgi:type VI secretion system secreted protein Hcp
MAFEFYVSIDGVKQGKFKGESVAKGQTDKILGLAFDYELLSPRDQLTGHAVGKRQHKPIKFTKAWGAASPQIFQAVVTQEVLKTVLFEFIRTSKDGQEVVFYSIKLTNASISQLHQYKRLSSTQGDQFDTQELEDVSLTFAQIEVENKLTKTMASDVWAATS